MDQNQSVEVKLGGQEFNSLFHNQNKDLTDILQIDLVKEGILKYLDGSALINLSEVNNVIRQQVTYNSKQFKKCVNFKVITKSLDFFTIGEPLPGWTENLTQMTLVLNSELFFVSPEKFTSLTSILPNLIALEMLSEVDPNKANATFVNKILQGLSCNVKSLNLPYIFMLNPIELDKVLCQQLQELKFNTTFIYDIHQNLEHFIENLEYFSSNCHNLKSFSCHNVLQVYTDPYDEDEDAKSERFERNFLEEIINIIEKNSAGLEKLYFGIIPLLTCDSFEFLPKLAKIKFPKLKIFELLECVEEELPEERVKNRGIVTSYYEYGYTESDVIKIVNNLSEFGQLTTLKLTLIQFPLELFGLIPRKFPQLKSLSLKSAHENYSLFEYNGSEPDDKIWKNLEEEDSWLAFLEFLTVSKLEELEIIRINIDNNYDREIGIEIEVFDFKISENFLSHLPKNSLRKLALKGVDKSFLDSTSCFNEIAKMVNLKELGLFGCSMYLDDFFKICRNLKQMEKMEISAIYNPESSCSTTDDEEIDYGDFKTALSSLNYMKVMSIEVRDGDFSWVLGSISFPYLNSLTLINMNLEKTDVQNLIGLNPMLKKLKIVRAGSDTAEWVKIKEDGINFEFSDQRPNLKMNLKGFLEISDGESAGEDLSGSDRQDASN